ncbi:lipase family protein [uncultured Tateyamaria sp.]|uniref:lipase family protein n=1 Tax=uncultured Tateyamaria sp. TaxID=455651 RepID=UPI002637AD90|nr:lipase family protein [uncultured Tateyamaria sp.]
MAQLSASVYRLKGCVNVKGVFPDALDSRTFEFARFRVRFVFVELEDRYVVCFRGSILRRASWKLNVSTKLAKIPFGIGSRMHSGYMRQALRAYHALKGRLGRDKPVILAGHSQGGALALCLATHLVRYQHRTDIAVMSFGQPKVGDAGYCRYLDLYRPIEVQRFVNLGDGVALCPPVAFGYQHCEMPRYLLGNRTATDSARFRFGAMRTLRKHPVALYVQNLEAPTP